MTNITFEFQDGTRISTDELGIIVERVEIGMPSIRTILKEVPGRDGVVDYTEYFGSPDLTNRMIRIFCGTVFQSKSDVDVRICNELHGRNAKIWFSNYPGFYFSGRITLSTIETHARIGKFVLECDCYPWRLKDHPTVVTAEVGTKPVTVRLKNDRRSILPKVTVSAETILKWGDQSVSLSPGDHIVPELQLNGRELKEISAHAAAGTSTIKFEYQEARL